MEDNLSHKNEKEDQRSENDFLKMKLMLERGAEFHVTGNENELPPALENAFLRNIEAFEKQFDQRKTISVFDKIGRPCWFKKIETIPYHLIDEAWEELSNYMQQYNIRLDVCSPNISNWELYRFTTEELFQLEIDDIDLPGMITGFIYDEFHPDPVYDNKRLVEHNLFLDIFGTGKLLCEYDYAKEGLLFNNKEVKDFAAYRAMINRFKSVFEKIDLKTCTVKECRVTGKDCEVEGNYRAVATTGNEKVIFKGNFQVRLIETELTDWRMKEIRIEGFNPE